MDWLWNRLRTPYRFLIDPVSKGTPILLGGTERVRMPARFTDQNWESFEPATVKRIASWIRAHDNGCLLDVGASYGVYALLATTVSRDARVIAFESSLPSLKGLRRMCQHASDGSVMYVHGFISERHTSGLTFDSAVRRTSALLETTTEPLSSDIAFVCLPHSDGGDDTPTHSLDGLIDAGVLAGRPLLLKCDVEGAELLALRGAQRLLRTVAPTLILSVHPQLLPQYGHSSADVARFLRSLGYSLEIIEKDWEEHWWCTPSPAPSQTS